MTRNLLVAVVAWVSATAVSGQGGAVERDAGLEAILAFERGRSDEFPPPWTGGPRETIRTDATEVHGGKASARIERTAQSANRFSTLTLSIPMDFAGEQVELRGYIRTRGGRRPRAEARPDP